MELRRILSKYIKIAYKIIISLYIVLVIALYIEIKANSHYIVINNQSSTEECINEPSSEPKGNNPPFTPPIRTYEVAYETFDVPLDEELQMYIIAVAKAYELEPELVFAVIKKESMYDVSAKSPGGGNVGLMQINYSNFGWLSRDLGVTDFQDPYNNVQAGCYILSILKDKYTETDQVLMAYNCGEGTAKTLWNQGIFTTNYTRTIHRYMEEITGTNATIN